MTDKQQELLSSIKSWLSNMTEQQKDVIFSILEEERAEAAALEQATQWNKFEEWYSSLSEAECESIRDEAGIGPEVYYEGDKNGLPD